MKRNLLFQISTGPASPPLRVSIPLKVDEIRRLKRIAADEGLSLGQWYCRELSQVIQSCGDTAKRRK